MNYTTHCNMQRAAPPAPYLQDARVVAAVHQRHLLLQLLVRHGTFRQQHDLHRHRQLIVQASQIHLQWYSRQGQYDLRYIHPRQCSKQVRQ